MPKVIAALLFAETRQARTQSGHRVSIERQRAARTIVFSDRHSHVSGTMKQTNRKTIDLRGNRSVGIRTSQKVVLPKRGLFFRW
jgi:hypothetical protein